MSELLTENVFGTQTGSASAGLYLTFVLAEEEFGVQILKVREIIGYTPITAVPRTAKSIKGVINLRGQVIPIVDLRLKFGMEENKVTEQTCIIVVETIQENREISVGIIVDRVQEVLDIDEKNIDPPPHFGDAFDSGFILGIAKTGSSVKILLDIVRVLENIHLNETLLEDSAVL